MPAGRDDVVITNPGAVIVSDSAAVSDFDALSVTFAVNVAGPAVEGVPDIVPPPERLNPAGSDPLATDHEYGAVPPVTERDCEYGVPTVPFGRELVPITGGPAAILTEKLFVVLPFPASVNRTVNAAGPAATGAPLMTPVVAARVKP